MARVKVSLSVFHRQMEVRLGAHTRKIGNLTRKPWINLLGLRTVDLRREMSALPSPKKVKPQDLSAGPSGGKVLPPWVLHPGRCYLS